MTDTQARWTFARAGAYLAARGLAPGMSGNMSVKLENGYLMTPTRASLAALDPARLSLLDDDGEYASGDAPTKEAALHLAMYRVRPDARAVVHLHAPFSAALACLRHPDARDVLPKLTPHAILRVGELPLVPYAAPGDRALVEAIERHGSTHHAVLLANHGPVVAGTSLDAAVAICEELEESARLAFLLHGRDARTLSPGEVGALRAAHGLC